MDKLLLKYITLCVLILILTAGSNWAENKQSSISDEVETYLRDGIEFANQGQYNDAIKELNKALELDETDINTLCALGTVYVYKDMYEEAIETLRKAIKIDSKASVPYYVLAMVYEKQGEYKKAVVQWRNFIKVSSNKELVKVAKKHIERLKGLENE